MSQRRRGAVGAPGHTQGPRGQLPGGPFRRAAQRRAWSPRRRPERPASASRVAGCRGRGEAQTPGGSWGDDFAGRWGSRVRTVPAEVESAWLVESRGEPPDPGRARGPNGPPGDHRARVPQSSPDAGPGSGSRSKLSPSQRKWATGTRIPPRPHCTSFAEQRLQEGKKIIKKKTKNVVKVNGNIRRSFTGLRK